jgi:hypothetical protein
MGQLQISGRRYMYVFNSKYSSCPLNLHSSNEQEPTIGNCRSVKLCTCISQYLVRTLKSKVIIYNFTFRKKII